MLAGTSTVAETVYVPVRRVTVSVGTAAPSAELSEQGATHEHAAPLPPGLAHLSALATGAAASSAADRSALSSGRRIGIEIRRDVRLQA